MLQRLRAIIGDSRAATAIEYGLIISLIVIVMVGSLQIFAGKTTSMLNNVAAAVSNAG